MIYLPQAFSLMGRNLTLYPNFHRQSRLARAVPTGQPASSRWERTLIALARLPDLDGMQWSFSVIVLISHVRVAREASAVRVVELCHPELSSHWSKISILARAG